VNLPSTVPARRPVAIPPASNWWCDRPGARLGDLFLVRRVGRGGTATVYEARHRGRVVVCKLLAARRGSELELARRLRDEGRHLAEMGGGPWPAFVAGGELPDGRPYLLMERLRGRSLREHLRRFGPVAPGRVRRWMAAVLSALGRLHARGFAHCDVKPENVFLCHDGRIELLDLGAAERIGERLESPIGTPPYMAPEQRVGEWVDGRTDVFAAGWLAAELLTARGREGLPPRWRPVIDRACAVDRAARYPDVHVFAAALCGTSRVSSSSEPRAARSLEPIEVLGNLEPIDLPEADEAHRLELAVRPNGASARRDGHGAQIELERLHQGRLTALSASEERPVHAQLHGARAQVRHGHVGVAPHARASVQRLMTQHGGKTNTYM
jgi:serine/threonine protein kinase